MANSGSVDYKELQGFKKKLEASSSKDQTSLFIEACAKELAARLLAKVIKRTPVGKYPKSSGRHGGTLEEAGL